MTSWQAGQVSMNQRLRREITLWEPQRQMMDNSSTYSAHYKAWPVVRQKGHKPKDNRQVSDEPFDTRSTMQDSFQNWRGNHASRSCRPTTSYEPTQWGAPISTTHREAFQKWGVAARTSYKPKPNDDLRLDAEPFGRSTMQDSYQPIRGFRPTVSAQPKEKALEYLPFDGTTTSRAAYQPWPIQPRHGRKVPEPQVTMSNNNDPFPSTTYRDMFREVRLPPMATSSLGLQVVGGKFHTIMPRGTAPPARKSVMMTTTLDNQTSVDIVAVLSQSEQNRNGKIVGEFTFDGIPPAPKGIPQIEITFNLDVSNNLRVSAVDLAGNRVRGLTVQEKVRL